MSETRSNPPPVPCVEDYNSDDSTTQPNTKVEARKHGPTKRPWAYPQKLHTRDAASDSGYSSTVASSANSHPATSNQPAAQAPPPITARSSKPTIHRTESQHHQSRPSRSASVSRQPAKCSSPTCQDPTCASSRGARYDLPHRPPPPQQQHSYSTHYPVQNPMAASPYVQAPSYHQPQRSAAQPIPIYGSQPQARPRTSSTTRSRPVSWAAGSYGETSGYPYSGLPQGSQHGPPPSQSAYLGSYTSQYPGASYMASYLGSGSPRNSYGSHLPAASTNNTSSSSPSSAYPPPLPSTYSARQSNPITHTDDSTSSHTSRQQSSQPPPISARHSSHIPGSFPIDDVEYDSESQSSSSESEYDEEYEDRRRHERNRRRDHERERTYRELEDRRAMPPPTLVPARRPSLRTTRTTSSDIRHSREGARRAPHSENNVSTYDRIDSDRTHRHVNDKRLTYSPSSSNRHSRQSSVSNGSSSGRNKSSSLSQSTHSSQQYIVEDAHGRKYHYPTREQAEGKALRLREEAAEAYQASMRGHTQPSLSAENVKRSQTQAIERRPSSHVSGSSKKSAASSSKMSKADSTIQIQRGETVFNIPINTTLEVRQTDEGETWFIGSSSPPREKSYHGGGGSSKSSGSRMGRSRTGSEMGRGRRDTIHEEDGYERGL